MTLNEIKQLNITLSRETSFALMDDISEDYLDIFLNEFIPEVCEKNWEELSEEEIIEALREFNYSDYDDLDELLDDMSEIEVDIWKKKEENIV